MNYVLVAGLPGTGKTEVGDHLAARLNGQRLSTDEARKKVKFHKSLKKGRTFRVDERWKQIQRFSYRTMLKLAADWHAPTPRAVGDLILRSPYITIRDDERQRLLAYFDEVRQRPHHAIICEAPFDTLEWLDMFHSTLEPRPAIVEVTCDKAVVRQRLAYRERQPDTESMAGVNVYEKMLQCYQSPQKRGYASLLLDNSGTKDECRSKCQSIAHSITFG